MQGMNVNERATAMARAYDKILDSNARSADALAIFAVRLRTDTQRIRLAPPGPDAREAAYMHLVALLTALGAYVAVAQRASVGASIDGMLSDYAAIVLARSEASAGKGSAQ